MNLLHEMDYAWNYRTKAGFENLQRYFLNLISHSYVDIYKLYRLNCIRSGKVCKNSVFKVYEAIIIYLMKADGDFLQGEYDAYVKFADYAQQRYYSASEIRNMQLNPNDLPKFIDLIKKYRYQIPERHYSAFISGLCFLCFFGDKSIDENEFYILQQFFDDSSDYCPSTWEQLKKEW